MLRASINCPNCDSTEVEKPFTDCMDYLCEDCGEQFIEEYDEELEEWEF